MTAPAAKPARPVPQRRPGRAAGASGPERVCRLELASVPTAAPLARLHTADVLSAWGLPQVAETAQALVSELVANTIRLPGRQADPAAEPHRCRTCNRPLGRPSYPDLQDAERIVLTLVKARNCLLIEVYDRDPRPPVAREAGTPDHRGHSLDLVTTLSQTWNYYQPSEGGKVVWAQLVIPGPERRTAEPPPQLRPPPEHRTSAPAVDDHRTLRRVRDALRRLDQDEQGDARR